MLKLTNIVKTYVAGTTEVKALDDVSINFRKCEFVSVLGPSGSGKTTLLNIVGGLDQYSDGDLIIAGKSTKEFKDRDWDHYRNLRIGFIFQAYNLIPHQTVLSNVELALTISGVSKEERKERAKEALDKVGLSDQYYKKPNQLSGGQCQRVAIARALVNNPEILLADEPTGALDTKTSEQIMDLIKEIAKDRLVIMVTHNPDLANKYSTRIINLKDGKIISDTNPYSEIDESQEIQDIDPAIVAKTSKAKMGFWTAFNLSFKNLLSKRNRSILVAVASSIGIIGVSAVLAVSFGVTNYVGNMQNDMLSSYPVTIAEESVDYTSLISGLTAQDAIETAKFDVTTQVGMQSMINYLMDKYADVTTVKTNDINKNLVKYVEDIDQQYVASTDFDYGIDVTNNIFVPWKKSSSDTTTKYVSTNGLTQRYIASLKTVKGFSQYASYVDLFTNYMHKIPGDTDYILSQYDLLGNSQFAEEENQINLVVDTNTTMTDLVLAQMGYYSQEEFIAIAKKAITVNDLKKKYNEGLISKAEYDAGVKAADEKYIYKQVFNYEDLIGSKLYYFPEYSLYEYGKVHEEEFIQTTLSMMNYVGGSNKQILFMNHDAATKSGSGLFIDLTTGNYSVLSLSHKSTPATAKDELDGLWTNTSGSISLNVSTNAMKMTTGSLDLNGTTYTFNLGSITRTPTTKVDSGYRYEAYATDDMLLHPENYGGKEMTVSGILRIKKGLEFGSLSRGVYYSRNFGNKFIEDANKPQNKILFEEGTGFKQYIGSSLEKKAAFNAYVTFPYTDFSIDEEKGIDRDDGYATALNGDLSTSFSNLFASLTGEGSYFETDQVHYRSLSGYRVSEPKTGETSYNFELLPQQISIYPKDFASKDHVTKHLDKWNQDGDITLSDGTIVKRNDRKDVTYTDTVQVIVTVINTLIRIVTIALVAFTSLSLVVSCFMIAVITYISVMERIKEIGVIRSLGGRKKDVSRLFTAENLLTGLASGILGIAITYIISVILNFSISFFGVPTIAALPWWVALIMIAVSIFLSVLSGFIPSRKAAKEDPVNALRSE